MNVIRLYGVVSLACVCAVGLTTTPVAKGRQKKGQQVPGAILVPSASEGWSKSLETPQKLASDTDNAISWLKNEVCVVEVSYDGDGHGMNKENVYIKDSSMFRIQYPMMLIGKDEKGKSAPNLVRQAVIATGKRLALWEGGKGVLSEVPLASTSYNSNVPPSRWTIEFPKVVFSALRPGGHPFGNLVAAAAQPGSGLTAKVEEKSFVLRGRVFSQKRLTIQKANPKKGVAIKIQATIDTTQRLPVTIQTTGQLPGRPPLHVTWRCRWGGVKPGSLKSKLFEIPAMTKATKAQAM